MSVGYLGLGSNVGDRRAHLQAAVDLLPAQGVRVLASSPVYETEPVGEVLDQREFLNAVLRIESDLEPEGLLGACKPVERERGRVLAGDPGYVRHGPRPLDVDSLLLDGRDHASGRLTVPRPELAARRFVLVPLFELAPGLGEASPGEEVRLAGPPLSV